MRVLLAAGCRVGGQHFIGGVQSWIITVARRLSILGHEPVVWHPGSTDSVRAKCDLGFISHAKKTASASALCRRSWWVSHGIIPDERPPNSRVIFTSEDVRSYWNGEGPIVRQPIDLDFWRPGDGKRTLFLFYSYRAPDAFCLPDVAARLGLEFRRLSDATPEEARAYMRDAALVCASGRAALEAMACGAPTLICDNRPYNGGPLFDGDIMHACRANYSGRGGIAPTTDEIERAAASAMATQRPREFVAEHHDAARIVDRLLAC